MSGLRTESWARALVKAGMHVTVFTRDWEDGRALKAGEHFYPTENTEPVIKELENLRIVFLPYKNQNEPAGLLLKKFYNSYLALTGRYSGEADINQWYDAIAEEHGKNPFTHFITSCHPYSSLILIARLKRQFNKAITLADFRDYININLLNPESKFSLFSRLIISAQQKWITHYVKKIDLVTTASESISEKFEKVHGCKNVTTIYNGYEADLFNDIAEQKEDQMFNVSMVGALYTYQDIDFMLDGLSMFLQSNKQSGNIMINFIGLEYHPEVAEQVKNKLKAIESMIRITSRLKRSAALAVMKNSEVLFYVGWKGWKGIYSGKIFEYLGARKNILIAPNDHDVLEKLMNNTNAGKLANTSDEMNEILTAWYNEWQQQGKLKYDGIEERIVLFTRESQGEKLLKLIKAQDQ